MRIARRLLPLLMLLTTLAQADPGEREAACREAQDLIQKISGQDPRSKTIAQLEEGLAKIRGVKGRLAKVSPGAGLAAVAKLASDLMKLEDGFLRALSERGGAAGWSGGEATAGGHDEAQPAAQTGGVGPAGLAARAGALDHAAAIAENFTGSQRAGAFGDEAPGLAVQAGIGGTSLSASPERMALPLEPKGLDGLSLAAGAAGPYRQSYEALGLKSGSHGEVLLKDGRPAPALQVSTLLEAITALPTALLRDPDYFSPERGGIPREHFEELKRLYRLAPQSAEFRHIELSKAGRDFQRSRACDLVSGDCIPHAKRSYKKGDDVPPQDLEKIYQAMTGYLAKSVSQGAAPTPSASGLTGLEGRVAALLHHEGGAPQEEISVAASPSGWRLPGDVASQRPERTLASKLDLPRRAADIPFPSGTPRSGARRIPAAPLQGLGVLLICLPLIRLAHRGSR